MLKLRNQQNYYVPPKSRAWIRAVALNVRTQLGIPNVEQFDLIRLTELILSESFQLIEFHIETKEVMGNVEAVTVISLSKKPMIVLRQDVYDGARNGEPRDKFTVGHELGHVFLHSQIGTELVSAPEDCPAFRSSEWQANEFSAELLAPAHLLTDFDTEETIIDRFGVSSEVAVRRVKHFKK